MKGSQISCRLVQRWTASSVNINFPWRGVLALSPQTLLNILDEVTGEGRRQSFLAAKLKCFINRIKKASESNQCLAVIPFASWSASALMDAITLKEILLLEIISILISISFNRIHLYICLLFSDFQHLEFSLTQRFSYFYLLTFFLFLFTLKCQWIKYVNTFHISTYTMFTYRFWRRPWWSLALC